MSHDQSTTPVEYRPVPGFPDYRVGSDGSVWSRKNGSWGVSQTWKRIYGSTANGYTYIRFRREYNDRFKRGKKLHRILLEIFVGPCPPGMEGCHNDGNSMNNEVSNLRWDTHANNVKDRERHGTVPVGNKISSTKLNEDQVREIRSLLDSGISMEKVAKMYKVTPPNIRAIKTRHTWKYVT